MSFGCARVLEQDSPYLIRRAGIPPGSRPVYCGCFDLQRYCLGTGGACVDLGKRLTLKAILQFLHAYRARASLESNVIHLTPPSLKTPSAFQSLTGYVPNDARFNAGPSV
jgi:hypothetical protein